ncbi:hypothetical protein X742_23375 [Mesorhizobium sp. LNHC232B00]|nr:hypothetical protein X742_23375 [Mesorhizobium sp. LNHC232B00]
MISADLLDTTFPFDPSQNDDQESRPPQGDIRQSIKFPTQTIGMPVWQAFHRSKIY